MAYPKTRKSIVQFNKGLLSPKLDARADTEAYQGGCRQLQNMFPLVQGGATRRRGFEFVAPARFGESNRSARVMRFQFSQSDAMILEWGEGYVRFFTRANGQVMDPINPSIPYELASPYTALQAFAIQVAQVNDVLYITHPLYAPRKLTRFASNDWTLTVAAFDLPPFLDQNVSSITLTISNASIGTGRTLTASDNLFQPEHVGSYWRIGHKRDANTVEIALTGDGTSTTIRTLGNWSVNTYGTWTADLLVQSSTDGGATWETVRKFTSKADANFADAGEQLDTEALYRLKVENWVSSSGSPAPRAVFTAADGLVWGLVKITAVTSATVATVTVVKALFATTATTYWNEGAFSEVRGYPTSLCFFQQRLWFAGTAYQPQTLWSSKIDSYEDFGLGTNDDDAVSFTLASDERNQILWLVGQKKLAIGTSGGIWAAYGDELEAAITATKPPLVLKQNQYPAAYSRALMVNGAILFVQSSGRKLREMVFDGSQGIYTADDLTAVSDQISAGGIVTPAYMQDRDSMVWAVTGLGKLVSMAYEKQQNMIAWAEHVTAGIFESVDTIKGPIDDEVWVSVRRKVNGQWRRYIERLSGYFNPSTDYAKVNVTLTCTSVTHTDPAIITQPESLTVYSGEQAIFSVIAVGATGYQWYKDGVLMVGETGSKLTIDDVEESDGADYHVVVTTDGDPITSDDATLTVLTSPDFPPVTVEYTINDSGTPVDRLFLSSGLTIEMTGLGWVSKNLGVTLDGGSALGVLWVNLNDSMTTPDVPSGYTAEFFGGLFNYDTATFFDGWLIYVTP